LIRAEGKERIRKAIGDFVTGGCTIASYPPEWYCKRCNSPFGSKEKLPYYPASFSVDTLGKERVCPNCGGHNPGISDFCPHCLFWFENKSLVAVNHSDAVNYTTFRHPSPE